MDQIYHFKISPTFMSENATAARAVAAEIKRELDAVRVKVFPEERKAIEFSSRKTKDRRKTSCFIDPDRRSPSDRRGRAEKELERKRRKEFTRHLKAQR